jgi:hypothetical protein
MFDGPDSVTESSVQCADVSKCGGVCVSTGMRPGGVCRCLACDCCLIAWRSDLGECVCGYLLCLLMIPQ